MIVLSTISSVSSIIAMAMENNTWDDTVRRVLASSGLWGSACAFTAGILGILAYRIPTNTFIAWHYILVKYNTVDKNRYATGLKKP